MVPLRTKDQPHGALRRVLAVIVALAMTSAPVHGLAKPAPEKAKRPNATTAALNVDAEVAVPCRIRAVAHQAHTFTLRDWKRFFLPHDHLIDVFPDGI